MYLCKSIDHLLRDWSFLAQEKPQEAASSPSRPLVNGTLAIDSWKWQKCFTVACQEGCNLYQRKWWNFGKACKRAHLCRAFRGDHLHVEGGYYITGDKWGKKKRLKYEWSAGNKFNTSYRDISVTVGENNSVVKPNYQQYTSLNKMLSNFSKVLMAHISFTAVINNRGIGKGIGGIRKGTKKNYIYVL